VHRTFVVAVLLLFLLLVALAVHAGMMGGVGQLMIPGQLQADPVLSHAIVTEAGIAITTESGNPIRTETDTP
jgi:hypothetical protein